MSDKELLELAAKAAGIGGISSVRMKDIDGSVLVLYYYEDETGEPVEWNPLADDGDALWLAVKLHIEITYQAPDFRPHWATCCSDRGKKFYVTETGDDPYVATRRAIVRAAAEIVRSE